MILNKRIQIQDSSRPSNQYQSSLQNNPQNKLIVFSQQIYFGSLILSAQSPFDKEITVKPFKNISNSSLYSNCSNASTQTRSYKNNLEAKQSIDWLHISFSLRESIALRENDNSEGIDKSKSYPESNLKRNFVTYRSSEQFFRDTFLMAYKKRNLYRFLFLYFSKLAIITRLSNLKQVMFGYPSSLVSLFAKRNKHEFAKRKDQTKTTTNLRKLNLIDSIGFVSYSLCQTFFTFFILRIESGCRKVLKYTKPLFLSQVLLISYIALFGFFCTFKLSPFQKQISLDFLKNDALALVQYNQNKDKLLSQSLDFLKSTLPKERGALLSSFVPKLQVIDQYGIAFVAGIGETDRQRIADFNFEILRVANYLSKFFIVWALLYVLKGIRPSQSYKNDSLIQPRIILKHQNKKRLTDLEGIEKFLPILQTLFQSFQKKSLFYKLVNLPIDRFELQSKPRMDFREAKNHQGYKGIFPKGYLLTGPPGTGKTLLAKSIAGEIGIPLICLSASEIQKQIDMGTKIGALRLRNLFYQAKKNTPCILFLDEIDSIGSREGVEKNNMISTMKFSTPSIKIREPDFVTKERESCEPIDQVLQQKIDGLNSSYSLQRADFICTQVTKQTEQESLIRFGLLRNSQLSITQDGISGSEIITNNKLQKTDVALLTEFLIQMDSINPQENLIVIGTTNYIRNLDSAFIRSGRFDRIIGLKYPGKKARIDLLQFYVAQTQNRSRSINFSLRESTKAFLLSIQKLLNFGYLYRFRYANRLREAKYVTQLTNSQGFRSFEKETATLNRNSLPIGSLASRCLGIQTDSRNNFINKNRLETSMIIQSSDWYFFAKETKGFSAADIAKVINESFLYLIDINQNLLQKEKFEKKKTFLHTKESILFGIKKIASRENF